MSHPERAYYNWQTAKLDEERENAKPNYGDGKLIFESTIEFLKKIS